MKLRDYQLEGADSVTKQFTNGVQSTLVEWATGCGKTILAAEQIKRFYPSQSLFVCNSIDLVNQAADKILAHTGIQCRIERANHRIDPNSLFADTRPIVATVQSLNAAWGTDSRRLHKFRNIKFAVFDEADMSVAETFERVFNHVGPECKVLGITATPIRHDKIGLRKLFQEVAHRYPLEVAIRNGYLVDIAARSVNIHGLDYSKLRISTNGDYNQNDLAKIMEQEEIIQQVAQATLEMVYGINPKGVLRLVPAKDWGPIIHGEMSFPFQVKDDNGKMVDVKIEAPHGRKSIMFCSSIAHAQLAREVLARAIGDHVGCVSSKTPEKEREDLTQKFRDGHFRIMCNCNCFSRGFDEPTVEMVLMGRPTASAPMIKQQLGRVTRVLPGVIDGLETVQERLTAIELSAKPFARVVDYKSNLDRIDMMNVTDILGEEYSDEVRARTRERMAKKGVMISVALDLMERKIAKEKAEAAEKRKAIEEQRKKGLIAGAHYSEEKKELFESVPHHPTKWIPNRHTGVPATPAQIRALASLGLHPLVEWTKREASMFITAAKKEEQAGRGWKLPPEFYWAKNKRPKRKDK